VRFSKSLFPAQPSPTCRIAILGGGITGLTALYALRCAQKRGAPVEPFLLEAADRLGGLIRTERVGEFVVEAGPDSFLTEKPEGIALAKELGLERRLIGSNDSERRTYIFHRNRLVPLPEDWQLFVPGHLRFVLASPLLPVSTRLAVASEALKSRSFRRNHCADESVAAFVRRHFGSGMLENVADPLLAGIYGGDTERLSVQSVLPRFYALEQQYGSLTRGMAQTHTHRTSARPTFTTLHRGMEELVESLAARAGNGPPSRVHLGYRVTAIEMHEHRGAEPPEPARSRYTIRSEKGATFEADAVILALPASEGAKLVRSIHSGLAVELESIPYTPAVLVALGYPVRPSGLPPGFGFLVPRLAKRRLLACTFAHVKFPFRAPQEAALLRCFLGGARDPGIIQMNDEDLILPVLRELQEMLGVTAAPLFSRVYRWPLAMPQYVVGHEERMGRIRAAVESVPGLFLAGNAYSGVGLSDSIRMAQAAAENAVAFSLARAR
jgi:oxygen-dependent protoporphyrinogen oxidase